MYKTILLASFIFPERLDWFINYLKTNFDIPNDKIFKFVNLDDPSKLIVTFKLIIEDGVRLNIKELFPNAIIIHKRGDALYTINALNRLIELSICDSIGNIDYKSVKIDWGLYQKKLIMIDNHELVFLNINRVF